ncbi:hypothetical protein ACROYT_G026078 [Oculina patagonica]
MADDFKRFDYTKKFKMNVLGEKWIKEQTRVVFSNWCLVIGGVRTFISQNSWVGSIDVQNVNFIENLSAWQPA